MNTKSFTKTDEDVRVPGGGALSQLAAFYQCFWNAAPHSIHSLSLNSGLIIYIILIEYKCALYALEYSTQYCTVQAPYILCKPWYTWHHQTISTHFSIFQYEYGKVSTHTPRNRNDVLNEIIKLYRLYRSNIP